MISNVSFASDAAARLANPGPLRQANRDLMQALRGDDLAAARQAYDTLAQAIPESHPMKAGSPFARLGEALAAGDMGAAKGAYADIFRSRADRTTRPPEPPPVTSTTGGTAGTLLNAVA